MLTVISVFEFTQSVTNAWLQLIYHIKNIFPNRGAHFMFLLSKSSTVSLRPKTNRRDRELWVKQKIEILFEHGRNIPRARLKHTWSTVETYLEQGRARSKHTDCMI